MWTPWGRQRSGHSPSPAGSLSECCSCRCGHVPMKSCRDCLRIFDGPYSSVSFLNQPWRFGFSHGWYGHFWYLGIHLFLSNTQSTRQHVQWPQGRDNKHHGRNLKAPNGLQSSFATIAQPLCHRARRNFGHLSKVNLARSLSLLSELVPMRRSIGQCRRRRHWCSQEGCQQKHNLWRWWPTLRKIDGRKLNLQRVWFLKEVQWSLKLVNTFCAWFVSY